MTFFAQDDLKYVEHVAQVMRICQLVPSVVTLYDYLITLDKEVDLVWVAKTKPHTFAKIVFVWNRYFGTLLLVISSLLFVVPPPSNEVLIFSYSFRDGCRYSTSSCKRLLILQGWTTAILIWSVQFVMLFRTFAMYSLNKPAIAICLGGYILQIITMFIILAISHPALDAQKHSIPGGSICTPQNIPDIYRIVWFPSIAFDCVLCALSIHAYLRRSPQLRDVRIMGAPLLDVLHADTFKFYAVIISLSIANATVWYVCKPEWFRLLQGFFAAAICVMGGRLVLSLRGAYYRYSGRDVDYDEEETRAELSRHVHVDGTISVRHRSSLRFCNRPPEFNALSKKISHISLL